MVVRKPSLAAAATTLVLLALSTSTAAAASDGGRLLVLASALDRRSGWEGGAIVTRTRLRIDRAMRGTPPAPVVEVMELGGRVGNIAQVVHGQPVLPRRQANVAVELALAGSAWRVSAVLEQVASVDPAAPAAAAAHAYVRTTTKDSEPECGGEEKPVFWPTATVHWVLDEACSSDTDIAACEAAVRASFQTWDDVGCSYLAFAYDGRMKDAPLGYDRNGSNLNVVKWVEAAWPGGPDAQAITLATIGCDSGKQLDADILINGTTSIFSASPQPPVDLVDIQNTLTHEVGHVVGFAHSPDPGSTMYATGEREETVKRDLTADDIQGLCDVYPLGHEPGPEPEPSDGCDCAAAPRAAAAGWVGLWVGFALAASAVRRARRQR